jgi:hypothetical protein
VPSTNNDKFHITRKLKISLQSLDLSATRT